MSFAELTERYGDFYTPTFEVRVGELRGGGFRERERFAPPDGVLSGIQVETATDRSNRFAFTLNDVFDQTAGEDGEFDDVVTSTFVEGTAVEMGMGYETGGTTTLVRGTVDSVRPNFPANGAPSVSVSGHDLLHGLTTGTGSGHWSDTDLKTVVEEVIGDVAFADQEVAGGDVTIRDLAHPETQDYQFLGQLAKDNDYEFFSRAGTFYFREPKTGADPTLSLEYGRALRSFTPGSDRGRPQVGTVKVRHNDQVNRTEIVGTAEVPGGGDGVRVASEPVRSTDEAERRARSIASEIADRKGGRGETLGLPDLQIGRVVELGGLGSFSGRYYVESTTHRFDGTGYTTSFNVRSTPDE